MNLKKEKEEIQDKEKTENRELEKRGPVKKRRATIKQFKVGITENGFDALNRFMVKVNENSRRKIKTPEVLELAVEKLNEKDIPKIQERVYTPDDKMEILFDEYNQRNPDKPLSREQFKTAMIEAFEKQVLSKAHKSQNGTAKEQ